MVRLGIAGLGTVAQGLLDILARNQTLIRERSGVALEITRVASRSAKPGLDLLGAQFSTDLDDLLGDDVDVVVELIGGEHAALSLVEKALQAGKRVVTANKAIIARHGEQLQAARGGSGLRFEAAVAGAIPILNGLREGLVANHVDQVVGIINGTCNFILTSMEASGTSFADALAEAQALGYAEADPTFDVDGIDAAHKLTILAALAFDCGYDFDAVYTEGIRAISAEDIAYAAELGYRIKHVGIAQRTPDGIQARVHPALIPVRQLLASVDDVTNAVLVRSDNAGQTLFTGPGAGALATASAVLADVVSVATWQSENRTSIAREVAFLPIEATHTASYLRIPVRDEPGVFANVGQVLSSRNISIEAAIQKEPSAGQDSVHIVILTGAGAEPDFVSAVAELQQLPVVTGTIARVRVESLEG
ncbi:MAG: homoserine dehydrogenase [Pseudomonadota bacterium]